MRPGTPIVVQKNPLPYVKMSDKNRQNLLSEEMQVSVEQIAQNISNLDLSIQKGQHSN